jgi:hypothetical protein
MADNVMQADEIPKPTFSQTALVRFPKWAFNQTIGRAFGHKKTATENEDAGDSDSDCDVPVSGTKARTSANSNGNAVRRARRTANNQS